jgi:hypothetical protein
MPFDQQDPTINILSVMGIEDSVLSKHFIGRTKICRICGIEKPLSEFNRDRTKHKDGRDYRCKSCYHARHSEGKKLRRKLVGNYAPPLGTPCGICKCTDKRLVWDHDNKKMVYRGWLCPDCNVGLGKFGDDIEGVRRALNYLIECEKNDPNATGLPGDGL